MTLYNALGERWDPATPALTFGDRTIDHSGLSARIRRASGWCAARNLGAGDVLALQVPKSLTFIELHLGALARGVVTLPIHPDATTAEVEALCRDAGAKVLADDEARLRTELDASGAMEATDTPADAVAVLLYTSGTTGQPKGVPLTHGNLLAGVEALHHAWRWNSDDVLLHALPLFHVHGLFVALYGALYAGAHTILLPRFDPDEVLRELPRTTVFMGVPTFYARLLRADWSAVDTGRMRLFTSGSAALPAEHHRAFEALTGHRILERYGMTEVGIVLSNPYDGERIPGTVGRALPHVEARIVDGTGQNMPADTVGEITIRGPSVFAGYLHRPDATHQALRDGWMHTGDLGTIDSDGVIRVVGRAKDLIIRGGMNVVPGEVEARLLAVPGVQEVAVFGLPDADLGELVAAAVVQEPGLWSPADLQVAVAQHLSLYKVPQRWFRVDELPRNAMGKVAKHVLRARYGVEVRAATEADLQGIVDANLALCHETEDFSLDAETVTRGVARVLQSDVGASYHLAVLEGRVVGQLMVTTEWSDWRNAQVWWIQSVYVVPEVRNRGVYRALHEHVRRSARRAGAAGLRLYVETGNDSARRTYGRVGMQAGHYEVFEQMWDPR